MPAKKTTILQRTNTTPSAAGFPPLPKGPFDILYADPPWDYKGQTQHSGPGGRDSGSAMRHYPTVTVAAMSRWPITDIAADDSLLFMWSSSPHLDQAINLGKAWGFQWATIAFVWDKQKVNPGFYTMSQCELCLVFKRGKIPAPRGVRNTRQLISEMRGRHSAKPDEVRQHIAAMFPQQNKIELFARKQTEGWTAWGLDADAASVRRRHPVATQFTKNIPRPTAARHNVVAHKHQ